MDARRILGSAVALLIFSSTFGQGKLVDRRDQAEGWYVPIHGQVLVNEKKADDVEVILYRDNEMLGSLRSKKNGKFELELDIDNFYSVRIIKEGHQEKLLYLDTTLPKDLVDYPDYFCFVHLTPINFDLMDPFYTDFPSAIIRYDHNEGGFYHSDDYLNHIQTRLAGVAKAPAHH